MSKIAIQGDSNGTGVFTIASPNSNTNRTITLPDEDLNLTNVVTTTDTNAVTRTMLNSNLAFEGICFSAYHTPIQTISNSTNTKLNYTSVLHDPNNNFNTSTSAYTAPINGWYWLSANIRGSVSTGSNFRFDIAFYSNGSAIRSGGQNQTGSNDASTHVVTVIYLVAGEQITVYINQNSGGNMSTSSSSNVTGTNGSTGVSRFEGFLLRAA
jgi:hypothetical protein